MSNKESFTEKVEKINGVSHCFCLAKWTQVTLDLMHGTNHSCHHPKRHLIDPEAVKKNPWALHNTTFKKEVRGQMLKGERPSECHYCWNIEDTPGDHYSDRIVKSLDPWSYPHFEKVVEAGSQKDYPPHYLEVMFDNACNFSCGYCLADISSSVKKEMDTFGPYPVHYKTHRMQDPEWKRSFKPGENPFIEAFWKWLPDIWSELQVFRITGGEPLLSKHTFRVLDYILDHPQENLVMAVNSNLGVEKSMLDKFLKKLELIKKAQAVKDFELYVSADTYGAQAEYIRKGMSYPQFMHNLSHILEGNYCHRVVLMVTFNLLSLSEFLPFLKDVVALKKQFSHLKLDISYLSQPEYLSANVWGEEGVSYALEALDYMKAQSVFSAHEVNKMERIYHWLKVPVAEVELSLRRSDFFGFISEYDKRYSKNFVAIFPQMKTFLIDCKKEWFLKKTDGL